MMKIDYALDVLEKGRKAYVESTGFYYPDFGGAIETAIDFMKKHASLEDEQILRSLKIIKIRGNCMRRRYNNCPSNSCSNCGLFVSNSEFEEAVINVSKILTYL